MILEGTSDAVECVCERKSVCVGALHVAGLHIGSLPTVGESKYPLKGPLMQSVLMEKCLPGGFACCGVSHR